MVRAILLDPEARGDVKTDPNYGHLRHPALFITNLLRAFDARSADGTGASDGYLNPQSGQHGHGRVPAAVGVQLLLAGLGVCRATAGVRGPEFGLFSTSTALRRANFVNTMVFSTHRRQRQRADRHLARPVARCRRSPATPDAARRALNALLLHGTMSTAMRDSIVGAVTAVPATNPLKRARTAVYLVATSSQYQVER